MSTGATSRSEEEGSKKRPYVIYDSGTFAMIPDPLLVELAWRNVKANGILVALALAKHTFADGSFHAMRVESIGALTGLGVNQVNRGKTELKKKGIIEPVMEKCKDGKYRKDRARKGHVARFRFTKEVWGAIKNEAIRNGGNQQQRR